MLSRASIWSIVIDQYRQRLKGVASLLLVKLVVRVWFLSQP